MVGYQKGQGSTESCEGPSLNPHCLAQFLACRRFLILLLGGLRPLVELCVEPAGLCGRCTGVAVPLRVVPSATGLPSGAHQAPPSLVFYGQEYWNGLPFPSPMHE